MGHGANENLTVDKLRYKTLDICESRLVLLSNS